MVNTIIRLIIFFSAKDGEAPYSQQKQDQELTVAQIMTSLLQNLDLNYRDIEWFALETNRDHSVIFDIASKYCISDSFFDYDGYSISSKGFLPAVVDIMVI